MGIEIPEVPDVQGIAREQARIISEQQQQIIALRDDNDALKAQLTEAQAQIEQWKTWGVIEIAVRNPNVASYMEEWEERATKAEDRLSACEKPVTPEKWPK